MVGFFDLANFSILDPRLYWGRLAHFSDFRQVEKAHHDARLKFLWVPSNLFSIRIFSLYVRRHKRGACASINSVRAKRVGHKRESEPHSLNDVCTMQNYIDNFGLQRDVATVVVLSASRKRVAKPALIQALGTNEPLASWLAVRVGGEDWGLISRDADLPGMLERRHFTNAPPRALMGLQPGGTWKPDLWHLRNDARKHWLGQERPTHQAEQALYGFLLSLAQPDAHAHSAGHSWGFWLCLLVIQLELKSPVLPALVFERFTQRFLALHETWLRRLVEQSLLRHHLEACLESLPLYLREQVVFTKAEAPEVVQAAFPFDAHGPWALAPFELGLSMVASRRGIIRDGRVIAPTRLLLPHALQSLGQRMVEQLVKPWCTVEIRVTGPLKDRMPVWRQAVFKAVLGDPDAVHQSRALQVALRDRPPCLKQAVEMPRRLPNNSRTLLWAVLMRLGETPDSLERQFLPLLLRAYGPDYAAAVRDYRSEWRFWSRRVKSGQHNGPSCATFHANGLCPLLGDAPRCNGTGFVLRDIEDLGKAPARLATQPVVMAMRRQEVCASHNAMNE